MTKARDLANAADVLDDVSATELSYVNGVTSAIQTQLNAKQATVANVNDTEIGYLDGVTSAIQTQLDAKVAKSLVDAKGDLLVGSANDTVSRLAVASTAGYVLTVDSAEATGLKWAAAAAGGMTVLASGNLSTSSNTLTLSSISTSYNDLMLVVRDIYPTNNNKSLGIQVNSVTDNDFFYYSAGASGGVYGNATVNAIAGGMANSNDQNYLIAWFRDYANTDSAKCIETVLKYNEDGGQAGRIAKVSGCANTTSAITSISVIMSSSDNFGAAGSYVLYGVK